MANNYTQSSILVEAEPKDRDNLIKVFGIYEYLATEGGAELSDIEDVLATLPEELADDKGLVEFMLDYADEIAESGFGILHEAEAEGVWVHGDEDFNITTAENCISIWLQYFDLPYIVPIEWASTCSRPRIGEFGGGVIVVAKDKGAGSSTTAVANAIMNGMQSKIEFTNLDPEVIGLLLAAAEDDPLVKGLLLQHLQRVQANIDTITKEAEDVD